MEISKRELEQIIKEEIDVAMEEGLWDQLKARSKGLGSRAKAKASGLAGKAAGALGATTAAGELAGAEEERKGAARSKEAKSLMASHAKKVTKRIDDMIKDATKLKLTDEPDMKKALSSVKSAATRLGNLTAGHASSFDRIAADTGREAARSREPSADSSGASGVDAALARRRARAPAPSE